MIRSLIELYIFVIIIDTILSYLPQFKKTLWAQKIRQVCGYTTEPIRRYLPEDLPFDISPLVVIVALKIVVAIW